MGKEGKRARVSGTKDSWYVMIIELFYVHPPKTICVPTGIVRICAKCSIYSRCFLFEILKFYDLKSPLKFRSSNFCPRV